MDVDGFTMPMNGNDQNLILTSVYQEPINYLDFSDATSNTDPRNLYNWPTSHMCNFNWNMPALFLIHTW